MCMMQACNVEPGDGDHEKCPEVQCSNIKSQNNICLSSTKLQNQARPTDKPGPTSSLLFLSQNSQKYLLNQQ